MAKTNSSFKFGKMNKIALSTVDDPHTRGILRRAMIDAELSYTESKNRKYSELRSSGQNQQPKSN